jgi:hypothetical protein
LFLEVLHMITLTVSFYSSFLDSVRKTDGERVEQQSCSLI